VTARPARPPRSFEAPERTNGSALSLAVPEALVEAVAERVAELLAERLPAQGPAPWLDVDGAADYLACKPHRVYDLVAEGRLRCAKDGRRSLFRREWLDDYLLGGERSA
jgi:excisionase family DNA binding protein